MNQRLNKLLESIQAAQLLLMMIQGVLIIYTGDNSFSLIIWVLLGLASLAQLIIILRYPKKLPAQASVDRGAMIRLRTIAILPYLFIIIGILIAKSTN